MLAGEPAPALLVASIAPFLKVTLM